MQDSSTDKKEKHRFGGAFFIAFFTESAAGNGLVLCFCILFFLFDKVPGKIHYRPDDHKKEGHSEEVKVFSEDFGKKLENGVPAVPLRKKKFVPRSLLIKKIGTHSQRRMRKTLGRRFMLGLNPPERRSSGYISKRT